MSIAIHEPWGLFGRFNGAGSAVAFTPAVDVREESDRFVVTADLPGVEPAQIDITAEKGILTLRGERKTVTRDTAPSYERLERYAGSFERRFALPDNVQADAIKAKFTHGVLEVSIPKQPEVAAKRVTVETH